VAHAQRGEQQEGAREGPVASGRAMCDAEGCLCEAGEPGPMCCRSWQEAASRRGAAGPLVVAQSASSAVACRLSLLIALQGARCAHLLCRRLYNNIIPPSELPQKANYYLFKEGIQPAWEDAANTNGGKWSIQLPREKSRADIDRLWLNTVSRARLSCAVGRTTEMGPGRAGALPTLRTSEAL
jgi:hypothetical protein